MISNDLGVSNDEKSEFRKENNEYSSMLEAGDLTLAGQLCRINGFICIVMKCQELLEKLRNLIVSTPFCNEKSPEFTISTCDFPTLSNHITFPDVGVFLASALSPDQIQDVDYCVPTERSASVVSFEESFLGSPLKIKQVFIPETVELNFSPTTKYWSALHCPIDLKLATGLLSMYQLSGLSDHGCLCIATNAKDSKRTAMMAIYRDADGVVHNYRGFLFGPSKCVGQLMAQLQASPKFDSSTYCMAVYDLIPTLGPGERSLYVVLNWRGCSRPFDNPPPLSARAHVHCTVNPLSPVNVSGQAACELSFLMKLAESMQIDGEDDILCSIAAPHDAMELIQLLISGEGCLDLEASSTPISWSDRVDLDFIDFFFFCLINVKSESQLVNIFEIVFVNLKNRELLPYIRPDNVCKMAGIVRSTFLGKYESIPATDPSEVRALLLDIALEKVRADILHWLQSKALISLPDLSCYVDESLSLSNQLASLRKLLAFVEFGEVLMQNLKNLPQAVLSDCLRQCLAKHSHFECAVEDDAQPEMTFDLHIPMSCLHDIVERGNFSLWRATLADCKGNQTIAFSKELPLPWNSAEPVTSNGSSSSLETDYYLLDMHCKLKKISAS